MTQIGFNPDAHVYTIGGRRVPGVHEILQLSGQLEGMPDDPEKMEFGLIVHKAIELDFLHDLYEEDLDEAVRGCLEAAWAARRELELDLGMVEVLVGDQKMGYATRIDALGVWRGGPVIVDWKTGDPWDWHGLQLAAGDLCLGVQHQRLTVHVRPDGSWFHVEHDDPRDYGDWRACLRLADRKYRLGRVARPPQAPQEKTVTLPVPDSTLFNPPSDGGERTGLF